MTRRTQHGPPPFGVEPKMKIGSCATHESLKPFALAPRQRGEGQGEGSVFTAGPLSRRFAKILPPARCRS